jgi:hypothetical protein
MSYLGFRMVDYVGIEFVPVNDGFLAILIITFFEI